MFKKLVPFLVAANVASLLYAEAPMRSLPTDKRAKAVMFQHNQIYLIQTAYLTSTDIIFSKNETVEDYHLGDASSWDIATSQNHLYLKAKKIEAAGNLNVTTNKFNYHFILTVPSSENDNSNPTLILQFKYPNSLLKDEAIQLAAFHVPKDMCRNENKYNMDYSFTGSKEQAPIKVCDDGLFTYFQFPSHVALPAIFAVLPDRHEEIVNYRMEKGYVVVERMAKAFTLRNGNTVTSVYNDNYIRRG